MGVKLIGFEKLEAKLTRNMDMSAVKTVVKKNGAEMQKKSYERSSCAHSSFTKVNYVGNYRW